MRALTCGAVAELLTASIASYPIHCLGSRRRVPCWLLACFCTPAPPPARNPAARHTALQRQRSRVGVTVAWREAEKECDCARAFGEFSMVIRHAEQSWTGGREDERAQEEYGKDDMRSKGKMVFL